MPFQDINVLPVQANFVQLGNLQEPAPTMLCEFSGMGGTAEGQISDPNMQALAGKAELNPNGSWLSPASTIPGGFPGTNAIGRNQLPLPMQPGFIPNRNWVDPASVAVGDLSCTLGIKGGHIFSPDINTVPIQAGFIPDGKWLDLASLAAGDISRTLGMEGSQTTLFPDINTAPMQAPYIPNGNLREPVEPGSISNASGSECTQTLEPNPGASSGEAVDASWRTIEEAVPDELQEVAQTGQGQMPNSEEEDFSEYINFIAGDDPQGQESSVVLGMGDHQVLKRDEDTFSEQVDLSTVEAFQGPNTTKAIDRFSFLGTGQRQVSHPGQETLAEQSIVTKGEDYDVVLPKTEGFGDAQPTTPIEHWSLFGSGSGEMLEPDLAAYSARGNSLIEYGIPDVLWDIGAIGESHMSPQ